jgi:hypothetical protein
VLTEGTFLLKGKFLLVLCKLSIFTPYRFHLTLGKVILTSSLEDPSFGMTGIGYFNSVVQVSRVQFMWLTTNTELMGSVYYGFRGGRMFLILHGEQAVCVCHNF